MNVDSMLIQRCVSSGLLTPSLKHMSVIFGNRQTRVHDVFKTNAVFLLTADLFTSFMIILATVALKIYSLVGNIKMIW